MTDKTQTHSSQTFNAEEFVRLWQEKWTDMLREKGWPEGMAMPGIGQMPFMMPFMPNFSGFAAPQTASSADSKAASDAMQNRIAALEARIAVLEKKLAARPAPKNAVKRTPARTMPQRNKAPAKKTTSKG